MEKIILSNRAEILRRLGILTFDEPSYVQQFCYRIARKADHAYDPQGFVLMLSDEIRKYIDQNVYPAVWGEYLLDMIPRFVDALVPDVEFSRLAKGYASEMEVSLY